jgi:hypothetical protein
MVYLASHQFKKNVMKNSRRLQLFLVSLMATLLLVPVVSFAADKPDFTGQWTLNESKSDLGEGGSFAAIKMTVTQKGNSLTIERTRTGRDGEERTNSETFTMDGKENIVEGENRTTTSVVTWSADGSALTIKAKREFERQGETFEMNSTEVWTLAEGGKTLHIKSESSSQRGERSATLVYDKK